MMKFKVFLYLFILALLWGPAFLFTKVAVQDIPPLTLVTVRVAIAAAILYTLLKFQGRSLPALGKIWVHFSAVGLLYNAVPYVLLSWGQQYIDSALAAILFGTTPLFTLVLAHLFSGNDPMTPAKTAGVGVGFVGLVVLLGPALSDGVQATVWGLLASLLAAASYAGATVYSQKTLRGLPPLVGPAAQLTMATILLLPLAWIIEQPYTLPLPSWPAINSLLLLILVSTVLAFVVYYRALETLKATVLSLTTYLIPLVAMVLGVAILHEQLGWNAYLGFGLILLGVMIVNGILRFSWQQPASTAIRP
jgi:drug/metabolite transporter (DMT)-like permease